MHWQGALAVSAVLEASATPACTMHPASARAFPTHPAPRGRQRRRPPARSRAACPWPCGRCGQGERPCPCSTEQRTRGSATQVAGWPAAVLGRQVCEARFHVSLPATEYRRAVTCLQHLTARTAARCPFPPLPFRTHTHTHTHRGRSPPASSVASSPACTSPLANWCSRRSEWMHTSCCTYS